LEIRRRVYSILCRKVSQNLQGDKELSGGVPVAMGEKIRIEAETMEAALEEAERLLGKKSHELEVEVISQARKGILGIGSQKAIIDVWSCAEQEDPVAEQSNRKDGFIRIHDGQIEVRDPEEGGIVPTLIVGQHLQVIINGENIEQSKEVSSRDEILLIPHCSEPEWKPSLRVTRDGFQAFLAIKKTSGAVYQVKDGGPERELVVTARLVRTIEPEIPLEKIEEYLRQAGITFGIIKSNLQELISCQEEKEFVVAEGIQPVQPVDASIQVVFQREDRCPQPAEEEENRMERVILHQVISVEPGELLVEVVLPRPGKPGTDVKGKEIILLF
jgi:predicted RNA-binding protein Jag